jgi:hypothetical protein
MQDLNVLLTNPNFVEFVTSLKPLLIFIVGIVIYAIFVFKFYRFVARKNIFNLNLGQYNNKDPGFARVVFASFLYVLEYIILFPLFVFFWFLVFVVLLVFLSETANVGAILLSAMALIASIRVTSYFSENLSQDLAKLIPFVLLGGFLIDISSFSLESSMILIKSIPDFWQTILFYFLFVIVMEFVLRMIYFITLIFNPKKIDKEEEE